jgi:hypothetical protein
MSYSLGYRVTGYVEGKPEVFVSAMHVVYFVAALLMAAAVALTVVKYVKDRRKGGAGGIR